MALNLQVVAEYLKEYNNWQSQEQKGTNGEEALITPFVMDDGKVVFLNFLIGGDFLIFSTLDFITEVTTEDLFKMFVVNDTLKMSKLYVSGLNSDQQDSYTLDVGAEVYIELFNKENFFIFLDIFIESVMQARTLINPINSKYIKLKVIKEDGQITNG